MTSNNYSAIQACVDAERLEYLQSLNKINLKSFSLLSLPHQTILRVLLSTNISNDELIITTVKEYSQNFLTRVNCLDVLIEKYKSNSSEDLSSKNNINAQKMKYSGTSRMHCDSFGSIIQSIKNGRDIEFENEHGFAIFKSSESMLAEGRLSLMKLPECRYASVGAMMFYGFNLNKYPGIFFLQEIPIKILANIFYCLSSNTPDVVSEYGWGKMICHEMKSFNKVHQPVDFQKACMNFLISHEIGHSYVYKGNREILDYLYHLGLTDQDIYQPDFPSSYDLNAWERIKQGIGTKRDVCFILGDMLANLVVVNAEIPPLEHALLRAFNWSLVSPPSPEKRPRGNILFLRYSLEKNLDALLAIIEKIFSSLQKNKNQTAELMLRAESDAWQEMCQIYGSLLERLN